MADRKDRRVGGRSEPSAVAAAVARALVPPGRALAGVGPAELQEIYDELGRIAPRAPRALETMLRALDLAAVAATGRRLSHLPELQRQPLLSRWHDGSGFPGALLRAALLPLKLLYFAREEVHRHYGVAHDKAPAQPEPEPPHMRQAVAGHTLEPGETLEADVVVVGSGAAGAIVAKELAQRGHAVLLVEAGRYFRRHDFTGLFLDAATRFYRWGPENVTLGNVTIPVPAGRTVGGSTTINTATCFRPHDYVHRRWVERDGLPELSRERLAPHFEEVEATLQVAPVERKLWGRHIELMAATLDRLGLSHAPIRRNAPECDGQNCCDMGCPSGGKYSMDRSYVPMALRHGALLLTETRLSRVVIRDGRVRGVELESGGRRLAAAARRVVLCCGALATPRILWEHDLGGPAVGRNLTIHPSGSVSARLDQEVAGYGDMVPSSHYVDAFKDRRVMLISANVPVDLAAMPLQLVGRALMAEMERYERFGSWGVLLAESTSGRLVRLPGGRVACVYRMSQHDVDRIQWALAKICEIYFEAGAEACFPAVWGQPVVQSRVELSWFRAARLSARQLVLTAYHPLGTCRMGNDPGRSVVDTDYQVRGVEGLSIVDGSVVPGPLGVNSQLTVMAFARRAAGILHRQLEES
jgi:hypothetical protein